MRFAWIVVVALIAGRAEAICKNPPRACACDVSGPTVLDVRATGDGGYVIAQARGAPFNPDAGGDGLSAEVNDFERAFVVVDGGQRLFAVWQVSDGEFLCESSAYFSAPADVVLDAMSSDSCLAIMADAGVPEKGVPFECRDNESACGCGAGGSASALLAIAFTLLRIRRLR